MTVEISRKELSAAELREAAARCDDAAMSRLELEIALVLEGKTRMEAARSSGMGDRAATRQHGNYDASATSSIPSTSPASLRRSPPTAHSLRRRRGDQHTAGRMAERLSAAAWCHSCSLAQVLTKPTHLQPPVP
jgi:hypothetical protein